MEENTNKKSHVGIVIIIILLLLLCLFAVWYFLLKDKDKDTKENKPETEEKTDIKEDKPVEKEKFEYDYRDGVLNQIVDEEGKPVQTDFVIDGIILIGNRHSYLGLDDTYSVLENFVNQGYKKEGINSSFYLNEYIEVYLDTKYVGENEDVKVLITPHKTVEEYQKMSLTELEDLALEKGASFEYTAPDFENYNNIGETYVSMDYEVGKYDLLFIYKGKLAYFINLSLTKEE